MIDLLYHATIYYEICKYIQESEPATLKYEMVIEKANTHECNILEYKDHQASHGGANSAPSYNNPLLTAHALTKRRLSGQNTCHWCGKSHEQGNCPAYGKTRDKCKGINHFKAVCCSKVTAAKTVPSPHRSKKSQPPQRHGSTGSNNGHSKGRGRHFSKKKTPKKPLKQKAYEVTFKNLVLSEVTATSGGERENGKVSHQKTVLSISPCIPEDVQVTWGLGTRCRQRMPMLSVRTAVTQRQTDYKTFRRSLADALGHPVSRSWPSSSHHHPMKRITEMSIPGQDARSSLSQKRRREGVMERNKLCNLTLKPKRGPLRTVLCFPERSL